MRISYCLVNRDRIAGVKNCHCENCERMRNYYKEHYQKHKEYYLQRSRNRREECQAKRRELESKTLNLSEVDSAWLAALIDGEGCLTKTKRKGRFVWCLTIANSNLPLLEKAQKLMGEHAHIYLEKRQQPRGICYKLPLNHRFSLKKVLEHVFPFLIVKKEKTIEALGWLKTVPLNKSESMILEWSEGGKRRVKP